MSRVKIKVKKSSNESGAKIAALFDAMSGVGESDPSVIIPKICKVRNKVKHILKVLGQFATIKFLIVPFERHISKFKQILEFCDKCKEELVLRDDTEEKPSDYKQLPKEKVNLIYKGIKNSEVIQQIMILTSILKKFKFALENYDETKENFINAEPGSNLFIFRFSDLDFKVLWADPNMDSQRKLYIATVLKLIYEDGEAIYEIITSADVDPEEFASVMTNALAQLENQREISNCRDAFRTIRDSANMLKENMNNYYRESVIADNPSLMFTSFLSDVIKNKVQTEGKQSQRVRAQFMRICGYIQKESQKRGSNDPVMKKMMSNIKSMYKATKSDDINVKKMVIAQMSGINVDDKLNIDLTRTGNMSQQKPTDTEIKTPKLTKKSNDEDKDRNIDDQSDDLEEDDEIILDSSDEELLKEDEEAAKKDQENPSLREVPLGSLDISTKD